MREPRFRLNPPVASIFGKSCRLNYAQLRTSFQYSFSGDLQIEILLQSRIYQPLQSVIVK